MQTSAAPAGTVTGRTTLSPGRDTAGAGAVGGRFPRTVAIDASSAPDAAVSLLSLEVVITQRSALLRPIRTGWKLSYVAVPVFAQ
ncbi:hypothetical protein EVAR_87613_1 [Eumeta japonica]|uniref:Uncharacterized protein n=1 Tax=Eumeta variegata TaxID=151549 RepID=A0A4C1WLM1_EUMVA|nr:hypothetical protein EVAR_87613_1 [Eumeta japonica]